MLIPITIGYDGNKEVTNDLVELNHLLVYLSQEQMDVIRNDKDFIYEKLKSDDYEVCPIYFELKDKTNMYRMYQKIDQYYQTMEDRYDLFINEKCKNISEYNDAHKDILKHIVLLIYGCPDSEYLEFNKIENRLTHIMQLGRAAGVHIIIITDEINNMCDGVLLNFVNKIYTRKNVNKEMFYLPDDFKFHENELVYDCSKNDETIVLHYKKEDYIKENR